MGYTNSSLVTYTKLSPNHSGQRTHDIDRITPHCVVGQCTAESLGDWFSKTSTKASSNYGIDKNGRVGLYVEEKNRSWCSSSNANDQRAVTIECASDTVEPYAMNDKVLDSLVALCTDICKRNGKKKLIWFADKTKSLDYRPKAGEMVITVHRWFANKSCPGNWLYERLGDVAAKVTANLNGTDTSDKVTQAKEYPETPFMVRVIINDLNYRSEPSMKGMVRGQTGIGVFTIMEVRDGWGRLKSGVGWIWLDNPAYCVIEESVNKTSSTKTVDELAKEVIKGLWGNGADRKTKLTAAGYDYAKVQKRVNELLK
ncbi:N-acetylmuramoyl-L-alanine amidase [Clostridium perfringens]|uniref:N-acetylmuramoyl-L-alanine amidase n=1 Tax=Clostridium perfringens TaxID=1502 RepID=UPI001ABBA320|nr:N-acetylmuramoyl-L-alanine amidase [Clostridium perfringens]MBO3426929.1 N-acetylmuramoyl-L-alanine amidase [Clostridium perfringens]